jgi:primary-amine oxidase
MRLRALGSLLVLAALAWPAQAQNRREPSASHEMIAAALEKQGVLFLRQKDSYSFTLRNQSVTLKSIDNGARLVIKAAIKRTPPLDPLNVETGLDCFGITADGLHKFLTRFGDDLAAFQSPGTAPPAKPSLEPPPTAKMKPPLDIKPGSDDKEFIISFPTNVPPEKAQTAWKIVWDMETGKQAVEQGFKTIRKGKIGGEAKEYPGFGPFRDKAVILFKIKQAYYRPGPSAEWIQVLEDAHPQEFYVPYYFVDTRFFDLRDVGGYATLSAKEGSRVSQTLSKDQRVMAELRDRGVVYKHGNITRRGEELTLWANFAAGNYTYMIEFGFHDDGAIVFRHAPTGWNYYSHFNASHMHGSYWRVGVKLGPEGRNDKNKVQVVRLPKTAKEQEDKKGTLAFEEITKEGFVDWNAQEFTRIRITNPYYYIVPEGKDRPSLPIAYDLVTLPQGVARHPRFEDEKFTLHDFWITRHDCPEKMYVNLGKYFENGKGQPNPNLLPLERQNVTLWHSSAGLHTPRAEDGLIGGAGLNSGQAIVYWTSFELRPRNLFVKTPLYRIAE